MSRAGDAGSLRILRAGICHADELSRLHARLFDAAWDAASFRQLLAHPGAIAFVAQERTVHAGKPHEVSGFILGRLAADEAEILTLGVARDRQRLGIGGRLVEALGRAANKRGVCRLYLEVAAGNTAARALYDGLGFQESGWRPGYYARAGALAEDAVNLSLALERFSPARRRGGRL